MIYIELSSFSYIGFLRRKNIAGPGLEPGFSASKAGVLPLDDPADDFRLYQKLLLYQNVLILYKISTLWRAIQMEKI